MMNSEICNRESMKQHGLQEILTCLMQKYDIDDAKLSRQTGIPASTISRMRLSKEANPTCTTLRPIAKFFDISISQLLGDEPLHQDNLSGTNQGPQVSLALLPIIEWDDILTWVSFGSSLADNPFTMDWISSEREFSKNSFALKVQTDSLGHFLRKGTVILIDPALQFKDGDHVLVAIGDGCGIAVRQIVMDGENVYVRSVNPEIKRTQLLKSKRVLGVIVETRYLMQENKTTKIIPTKPELNKYQVTQVAL